MRKWLLLITVGPVQDFIAAARRTRDLWFGSYLLSEISKAVAKSISDNVGSENLIFPAPEKISALQPDSDLKVGNVIFTQLPEDADPRQIIADAKEAANSQWKEFAERVFVDAREYIDEEVWNNQIDDVVEFYAAWAVYDSEDKYKEMRGRVMQILAARKSCRNFKQDMYSTNRPKSSLDGARDSVLLKLKERKSLKKRQKNIFIAEGEQLDAVGLVKRIGGGIKSYPSTCRVAADTWIRAATSCMGAHVKLGALKEIAKANDIPKLNTNRWPQYENFPFDATILFPTRYKDYYRETGINFSEYSGIESHIEEIKNYLGNKYPTPYFAVLLADGDHMGKAISHLGSSFLHKNFSQMLSRFARSTKDIIATYNGCLVYSGGDDVLAFLPLDKVLGCAKELHHTFCTFMNDFGSQDDVHEIQNTTLSVGISIGHFIEPLEDLLSWARLAEQDAKKPDRNGLAIHWHSRSGASVGVRARWDTGFYKRLDRWIEAFQKGIIPSRIIYELRDIAAEYQAWPEGQETLEAIAHDLIRLLKRKRQKKTEGTVDWNSLANEIAACLDAAPSPAQEAPIYVPSILNLSNEWWISSQFARATGLRCREDEIQIKDEENKNGTT